MSLVELWEGGGGGGGQAILILQAVHLVITLLHINLKWKDDVCIGDILTQKKMPLAG
jgi:hypothetical protein